MTDFTQALELTYDRKIISRANRYEVRLTAAPILFADLPVASQIYLIEYGFRNALTDSLARACSGADAKCLFEQRVAALLNGTISTAKTARETAHELTDPLIPLTTEIFAERIDAETVRLFGAKPKTIAKKDRQSWLAERQKIVEKWAQNEKVRAHVQAEYERRQRLNMDFGDDFLV